MDFFHKPQTFLFWELFIFLSALCHCISCTLQNIFFLDFQSCPFNKKHDHTALRVFFSGNLRVTFNYKCKRWYFTFNGAECKLPMTIDGSLYNAKSGEYPHRHRHFEGYCERLPKGSIAVGLSVANCVGYGDANAHTGYRDISRIVIEEVAAPQP